MGKDDVSDTARKFGTQPTAEAFKRKVEEELKKAQANNGSQQTGGSFADHIEEETTPFPLECLPSPYRDMAEAAAMSANLPVVLTVLAVLAVLSSGISKKLKIRSGPNRLTPAILYLIGFVQSGLGKSESVRLILEPMFRIQEEFRRKWKQQEIHRVEARIRRIDVRIKKTEKDLANCKNDADAQRLETDLENALREKQQAQENLICPKLWTEDVTVERLATLLERNDEMISSISSDAGIAIQNILGRQNKLKMTDDCLYCQGYSLGAVDVERQTRGPVSLSEPAINLFWLTQPDKVALMYGNKTLVSGGFLPRCLVTDPDAEPQEITGFESPIPDRIRDTFNQHVFEIFCAFRCSKQDAIIVHPEASAYELMVDHYNQSVRRRKSELRDIAPFAARFTENAWRLALCLHVAKYGKAAVNHAVSLETAQDAIKIVNWFELELLRIMHRGRARALKEALAELIRFIEGKTGRETTMRELKRAGWNEYDVERLVQHSEGRLEITDKPPGRNGGRPSKTVRLTKK
jgi:hypothetical protein